MLLIPVRVAPSPIEGNGLFTVAPVPAGTPVWRFQAGFDQAFAPEVVAALAAPAREYLRRYAWIRREDGRAILSGDHACFMNHSGTPNTGVPPGAGEPETTIALRDLAAGEELTCDYRVFDAAAAEKLGELPAGVSG
ncbi:MAG TPA: SET domain-containing protein [Verrucomicrobiota bacterium]|nr:SET domain-containing protein [Verrucomicrobiota bacterium]